MQYTNFHFHTFKKDLPYKKSCDSLKTRISFAILFFTLIILSNACNKIIEVQPPISELIQSTVFKNSSTANAAALGIYNKMAFSGFASGNTGSFTYLGGLSSDELRLYSTALLQKEFFDNNLTPINSNLATLWQDPYSYIFAANQLIEGINGSSYLEKALKDQLTGEAKFVRAFCHFYLVNLFGDIPYVTTIDYNENIVAKREPQSEVYQKIIEDLKASQFLLSNDYSFANGERVRPNKWAATALLARVYLYIKDYVNAEIQSTMVIDNTPTFSLASNLNDAFLKNSSEAIWQLMPLGLIQNTLEGNTFILTGRPSRAAISSSLLDAFENNDKRRSSWIGSITSSGTTYYYPYKYKIRTGGTSNGGVFNEYSMVLRLAEQYLIRAESRAQQDKIIDALDDLNAIRNRAGLPDNTSTDRESLLLSIEHERQVELFTEWGHRWLDLKRLKKADDILPIIKGSNWQSADSLYPIPQIQMQNAPNFFQNSGY